MNNMSSFAEPVIVYADPPDNQVPWLEIYQESGGGGRIIPAARPPAESQEGILFDKNIGLPELIENLPIAAALEGLSRLACRLGESILITGSSFWSRAFIAAASRISLFPILWVCSRKDSDMFENGPLAGCRMFRYQPSRTVDEIKRLTGNAGCRLVIETTAERAFLNLALGAAGIRSRVGLVGSTPGDIPLNLHNTVHFKDLSVRGLWGETPPFSLLKNAFERGALSLTLKDRTGSQSHRAADSSE